jgi:bifunctional non-homologous end joining protein LigD
VGVEGLATTVQPHAERRELLEALELEGPYVRLVATFADGEALLRAVCDRGLEGIVAKRDRDPYRSGEDGWVKTKNRATARFTEERDGVGRRRGLHRRHGALPRQRAEA